MSTREEIRDCLNDGLKELGILAHFKADASNVEFRAAVECTLAALVVLEQDRLRKRGPDLVPEIFGTA